MVTQQLVYRLGNTPPRNLASIGSGHLEVVAHSSHSERLAEIAKELPELRWHENPSLDTEELLVMVDEGLIDYTIADSNEIAVVRRFYPRLAVAFDIAAPEPLAWAFPRTGDKSLFSEASAFIEQLHSTGELDELRERYYGHIDVYDYAGTPVYMSQVRARLPRYRRHFEEAGATHGLDWRLLAAMAYQESHWDPAAVSPTGVRGMMMLTQATAEYLGIAKRTDLAQSIDGGTRYLKQLIRRLPDEILEPDRTWMAVAAYNVGLGHLNDARRITRELGGDNTLWKDVKENLPLLRERSWYRKTRHGYARGDEPVRYVENIRSYYDILVWMDEQNEPQIQPSRALMVDSPSL
jgi:membrane-bound lytic murein transglycosylase F